MRDVVHGSPSAIAASPKKQNQSPAPVMQSHRVKATPAKDMENLVQEKAEHKQHIEAATAVPGEFQEEPGQQPQAKQLSMVGIVSISGSAPII